MPFRTVHLIAALIAAVAFVLAFIAAGVLIVSVFFMALGLAAIGWLAWSLIKRGRTDTHRPST